MQHDLVDPETVRKFVSLVHHRAAAAIDGMNSPPCVLHLCSAAPDDHRFFTSAFNIGDVEHMTEAALIDTRAGKNVFVEPRLVRPGRPEERGRLSATQAVFAVVADGDSDTGKQFIPSVPASITVETSPPDNAHHWYFLRRAIGAYDAQELGRMMREHGGGDYCSGVPTQPFRCLGTANYPNRKKIERGRVPVATRLRSISRELYSAEQLRNIFSEPKKAPQRKLADGIITSVGYSRMKVQAILSAGPGDDRSAQFFSAINHAVIAGVAPEQFEELCREYPYGCAGKYLGHRDRLREEIERCYGKIANEIANEKQ
jgi:hypothetical protein